MKLLSKIAATTALMAFSTSSGVYADSVFGKLGYHDYPFNIVLAYSDYYHKTHNYGRYGYHYRPKAYYYKRHHYYPPKYYYGGKRDYRPHYYSQHHYDQRKYYHRDRQYHDKYHRSDKSFRNYRRHD